MVKRATVSNRTCLKCDRPFHSEGRHNRCCSNCVEGNLNQGPVVTGAPKLSRGIRTGTRHNGEPRQAIVKVILPSDIQPRARTFTSAITRVQENAKIRARAAEGASFAVIGEEFGLPTDIIKRIVTT